VPEQLLIGFNPMSAANRVAYFGSQIRSRLIWLGVSVLICAAILIWQRQSLSGSWIPLLFAIGMAYSLVWLVIAIVSWARAKSALAAISPGVAAAVDRRGFWLAGQGLAWPEIAAITINRGRFGGSPHLRVQRVDGQQAEVSLAVLDALPGTIDAAVRAYSSGTHWIDTSKMGH
jgi:hypothetical protein